MCESRPPTLSLPKGGCCGAGEPGEGAPSPLRSIQTEMFLASCLPPPHGSLGRTSEGSFSEEFTP